MKKLLFILSLFFLNSSGISLRKRSTDSSNTCANKQTKHTKKHLTLKDLKKFCQGNLEKSNAKDFKPFPITTILSAIDEFTRHEENTLLNGDYLNKGININKLNKKFQPFVRKVILDSESTIAMWGDLHGSIHSLYRDLNYLYKKGYLDNNLKILKTKFYMAFLGDFVDRGTYGIEVIYTLITLKLKNPEQVILVRGNHEDIKINNFNGFTREIIQKYNDADLVKQIGKIYDLMPIALFLGIQENEHTNFIQCCHGAFDLGYNPKELLDSNYHYERIKKINRKTAIDNLQSSRLKRKILKEIPENQIRDFQPSSPTQPVSLGLMWHDFAELENEIVVGMQNRARWKYGQSITEDYLKTSSSNRSRLRRIIRAHQHYGKMLKDLIKNKGIVNLWNAQVITLLSAPSSNLGEFIYDSFIMLKTATSYEDIEIEHVLPN